MDVSFAITAGEVSKESTKIQDIEVFKENLSKNRTDFDTVGTSRLVPELAKDMRDHKADVLCFIPGFNHTFRESIKQAALIAALYSKPKSTSLIAALFSWPSDGSLSIGGYLSDRTDAELSGLAIARTMNRLSSLYHKLARERASEDECGQNIHLVAHSMGVHALRHALEKYPCLHGARVVRFFDTAILAAADTERDALERTDKMALLARLAKSVHCYINDKDKALEWGDEFVGPPDRLGSYGPYQSNILQTFGVPLSIIDCRGAVTASDLKQHQYYRKSYKVISDVIEAINGCRGDEFTHRMYDENRGIYTL
ncbi:MAG: alpha/beta hydrolase [Aestuariivita sp.]|nr:alpha/beta hydrolase [Aestuariivita sp.]